MICCDRGWRPFFRRQQLEESARLAASGVSQNGREDLRELPVFTIDGPNTRDFDDAVSLEIFDDEMRIGVHIADVAAVIEKESPVDAAAKERASSLYLPRRQIPMIPTDLSQDLLSLKEECVTARPFRSWPGSARTGTCSVIVFPPAPYVFNDN